MSYTGQKKRDYQNQFLKERRDGWIEKNGPCSQCKTWDNLEIDHIDPKDKEMQPSHIWSRKEAVRLRELAKCQVLCRDCHLGKTRSERHSYRKPSYDSIRSLTAEQVTRVKALISIGHQPAQIRDITGIKRQIIKNIKRGHAYANWP